MLVKIFTIRQISRSRTHQRFDSPRHLCRPKQLLNVKSFRKFILVCAFLFAMFVANVNAEPAVAVAAPAESKVPSAAEVVFNVFGLPVTNSMICTWIVAAIILVVVRVSTWKNIKEVPSGMQNVLEAMVEGWDGLIGDILDKRVTRWVFP